MLASEYILIDISLISSSPSFTEHDRALEYTISFLSLPSDSTGLKEHRISAQQKALYVVRHATHIFVRKSKQILARQSTILKSQYQDLLRDAYSAFNARDIDRVLLTLHPNVCWSNGWEGGYVNGHDGVRNYWIRQWKELDPNVEPVGFKIREGEKIEVEVHQTVKDLQGNVLFEGRVNHIYTIKDGLIQKMDIEKP